MMMILILSSLWNILLVSSSPHQLMNRRAVDYGMCLYNHPASLLMVSASCAVATDSRFFFNNTYNIVRVSKNLCITAPSLTSGVSVEISTCSDSPMQMWEWGSDEMIRLKDTNMCLDFAGLDTATGPNNAAIIKSCNPATKGQKWARPFTCPPGMEINPSWDSCTVCPDGYFKNETSNFARCVPCPAGLVSSEDYSSCISCPSGRCSWQYYSDYYAGMGSSASDGPISGVSFSNPTGITMGRNNTLLVVEQTGRRIRSINGTHVTTVAGNGALAAGTVDNYGTFARFNAPSRIFYDVIGNTIYVTDETADRVRKINQTNFVSTLPVTTINTPRGILLDFSRNILIADSANNCVRRINETRSIDNFAGLCSGGSPGSQNGPPFWARLRNPAGMTFDKFGNMAFADFGNSALRYMNLTQSYITYFGSPGLIGSPSDIVYDQITDRFYVTNRDANNAPVFMVMPNGFSKPLSLEGPIVGPWSLTVDSSGVLYVASSSNNRIYRIYACPPFTIWNNSTRECLCMAGYESAAFDSKYCSKCSLGMFKNNTSSVRGEKCRNCPLGTQSNNLGTDCVSCQLGVNYRPNIDILTCIDCPKNSECTPTGFTCMPGYIMNTNGTACVECPENTVKSSIGNGNCTRCQIGQEPKNKTRCEWCSDGYFKPTGDLDICVPCPEGAKCTPFNTTCLKGYTPSKNQSFACSRCDSRSFKDQDGNFDCTPCPGQGYASDDYVTCLSCPQGYYRSVNGTCDYCPIGKQPNHNRTTCVECQPGKYKPDSTYPLCINCPRNSICTPTNSQCNPGYSFIQELKRCVQCTPGYAKPQAGNQLCIQCGVGTQSNSDMTECTNCPNGKLRSSLSNPYCTECPLGATCTESSFSCNEGWRLSIDGLGCNNIFTFDTPGSDTDGNSTEATTTSLSVNTASPPGSYEWSAFSWDAFYRYPIFYFISIPIVIGLVLLAIGISICARFIKRQRALFAGYTRSSNRRKSSIAHPDSQLNLREFQVESMEYAQDAYDTSNTTSSF